MGAAAYARRSRQSQPRGWKKTSDESRPPVPRMSVEKWVDVASWLGDVWPVASEEAAKQPENLGSLVFSIARDAARSPHTKSSGSSGSVSGSGEAKGGGREGEACPCESRGRSRRRVPAMSGNLPQGTRWREAASRAVELAEGQMAGTSGQRATSHQNTTTQDSDMDIAAKSQLDEPDARMGHVRICGSSGWVTACGYPVLAGRGCRRVICSAGTEQRGLRFPGASRGDGQATASVSSSAA